jgi:hypothetical protein
LNCGCTCRGIDREGDVGRHVEDDLVALTRVTETPVLQLGAQFGFLLVHVAADGRAGEAADAGADQGATRGSLPVAAPMMAPTTAPPPHRQARRPWCSRSGYGRYRD